MFKKGFVIFITASALLLGCTSRSDRSSAVAADFKLQDLNGKTVRLSDFKGKPVLIDFWATWCPPCRASIPEIVKLDKTYSSKGLVVISVSLDEGDWDAVKAYAKEVGITYPVLKANEDVTSDFLVRSIPMVVIINKEGKVVKRYLGLTGDDDDLEQDVKAVL